MHQPKVQIMQVSLRALSSIVSSFVTKCVAALYNHACVEGSCTSVR